MEFEPVKKVEEEFKPVKIIKKRLPQEQPFGMMAFPGEPGIYVPESSRQVGEWIGENPRVIGAGLGALRGSAAGWPGAVGGAVLGGALGEEVGQIGQLAFGSQNAPRTEEEALKRTVGAGVTSGFEELGGAAIAGIAGKVISPFGKYMTDEAKVAWNILKEKMPKTRLGMKKPPLTLAEATQYRPLDYLDNIAHGAALGQQSLARFEYQRMAVLDDLVNDFANKFPDMPPTELGDSIVGLLEMKWNEFNKKIATPLYNTVEKLAPNASISLKALKDFAENKAGIIKMKPGSSGANIIETINSLDETIPYSVAKELRSDLREIADAKVLTEEGTRARGIAKKLHGLLTNAIDSGLTEEAPRAARLWKGANNVYKEAHDKYRNKFIRRLINKAEENPQKVLESIFTRKGTKGILQVKNAVGPRKWEQIQGWYVRDLLAKSTVRTKAGETFVSGKALKTALSEGQGGMGEESLSSIFNQNQLSGLKNLSITLSKTQEKQPGRGGSMLIQLMQAGSLASIAVGQFEGVGWTVLIGPEVLSRIMISPTASKWFLNSIKIPQGGKLLPANLIRITEISKRFREIIDKEKLEEQ